MFVLPCHRRPNSPKVVQVYFVRHFRLNAIICTYDMLLIRVSSEVRPLTLKAAALLLHSAACTHVSHVHVPCNPIQNRKAAVIHQWYVIHLHQLPLEW